MDASTGRSEGTIASIQPHRNDEAQPSCSTSVSDARSDVGEENQPKPNRNTFALEVPVLLLFFSWNLSATVFQNQILFQTCKISFPFNNTYCTDLINGDVIDKVATAEIEKYAATIFMSRAILENIIPAFISFFLGPWSDKYGRKPILLSTFCGYFLIYFILAMISWLSTVWWVNPWYYLLAFIPISVLGGTCALIASIFCYITDVSTQDNRAFRMARMEAVVFVGLLLGALSSVPLYIRTSATFVFFCGSLCNLCGLVYIYFFVRESIQLTTSDIDFWTKFKSLFDLKHLADMFRTVFKKRDGYDRAIIWLTMLSSGAAVFIMEGSVTLSYLFLRERFDWAISDYNFYTASNIIVQIFGNIFGIYILSRMFGVSEILIAMIAYASSMTEYIFIGCAAYPWQLYVASVITFLKGVAAPMSHSILASVVPPSEVGKIYSMTTSIESLSPIGSAPLYTYIFSITVHQFPGAFNFVSAFIFLGCVLMILLVYVFYRKRQTIGYASIS